MRRLSSSLVLLWLFACAGSPPGGAGGPSGRSDGSDGSDGSNGAASGCRATPADPDRGRVLLTNLPYDGPGTEWAVLDLGSDGALVDRGLRLQAGRAGDALGVSSADGSLLAVAQDDGTVAIFAVAGDGAVSVVDAGWSEGTYASALAMDPSGERLYLLNGSRGDVGGGVTVVVLDCDTGAPRLATPADGVDVDAEGLLLVADHPKAMFFPTHRTGEAVLVAQNPSGIEDGADVALLDLTSGAILERTDAFADPDDAWLGAAGWSAEHALVLVGDGSSWSGRPNSVAGVALDEGSLSPVGSAEVYDPAGIVAHGDHALASSGFGDELVLLEIGGGGVVQAGTLATTGVPQSLVGIERGSRAGLVVVSEVGGVRRVQLSDSGATDLGVSRIGGSVPGGLVLQR